MNAILLLVCLSADPSLSPQTQAAIAATLRQTGVSVPAQNVELPAVDVYAPSWCAGCKLMEREVADNGVVNFRFEHDEKQFPAWVHGLLAKDAVYPILFWKNRAGVETQISTGWEGLHKFLETFDRHELRKAAPVVQASPKSKPQQQAQPYVYGSHWSVEGDWSPSREEVIEHLLEGDLHRGRLSRRQLEDMSREQLLREHDRQHNEEVARRQNSRQASAGGFFQRIFGSPRRSSHCPNCPNG